MVYIVSKNKNTFRVRTKTMHPTRHAHIPISVLGNRYITRRFMLLYDKVDGNHDMPCFFAVFAGAMVLVCTLVLAKNGSIP